MKIYRGDLQRFETPQLFHTTLSGIGIDNLGNPETPVELELAVERQGEDFHLSGWVRTRLTLVCDRCLGPAVVAVDGTFQVWLVPAERPGLNGVENEVLIFPPREQAVDLGGIVAETINLGLLPKTLCREDCRGLCPTCGADMNQQPCGCETRQADERWSPLLKIRQQMEK